MSDRSINWHFVQLHCCIVWLYRVRFFYIKIKRIRIGRLIIVIHTKITFQISQCNYEAIFYVYLLYRCISTMSDDEHLYTVQTFNFCTSRPDVCQRLVVQIPMDNMSKNKPNTVMTQVACELKLRSVVRSSMHPCPGN